MERGLTLRALNAINAALALELEQHDGVVLRLAHNVEDAWKRNDHALVRELCEAIEHIA